jgi:hypothetical protein
MINTAQKKKAAATTIQRKLVTKVNEQESKDIMNQLFDDLDNNDVLDEHHKPSVDDGPAAFSKQEAVMQ